MNAKKTSFIVSILASSCMAIAAPSHAGPTKVDQGGAGTANRITSVMVRNGIAAIRDFTASRTLNFKSLFLLDPALLDPANRAAASLFVDEVQAMGRELAKDARLERMELDGFAGIGAERNIQEWDMFANKLSFFKNILGSCLDSDPELKEEIASETRNYQSVLPPILQKQIHARMVEMAKTLGLPKAVGEIVDQAVVYNGANGKARRWPALTQWVSGNGAANKLVVPAPEQRQVGYSDAEDNYGWMSYKKLDYAISHYCPLFRYTMLSIIPATVVAALEYSKVAVAAVFASCVLLMLAGFAIHWDRVALPRRIFFNAAKAAAEARESVSSGALELVD